MGKCAVCGDNFAAGVVKDLMGMDSGIISFSVGFVDQRLYAHDPKCVDALKHAFDVIEPDDIATVHSRLPNGPLKDCLATVIGEKE